MNMTTGKILEKGFVSRIAWLYFIKGFTQREISHRLNISRMQVQRSISKARNKGLVKIEIIDPHITCFEIEEDLKTRFLLSDVIVTPTPRNKSEIKKDLGKASAGYLLRHITDGMIIGVGWGTTLEKMAEFINGKSIPNSQVVSLIGGSGKRTLESPYEVAFKLADALKTPCYYISAPAIAGSCASRSVIIAEKSVNNTLKIAKASNIAVLGIGNADMDSSLVKSGLISSKKIRQLREKGAVGDICAQFYDYAGQPVDHGYMDRVIGLNLEDLKKIKTVIGIAGGKNKIKAIIGALRGSLLDVLITDERTAKMTLSCILEDTQQGR
jgi:DNA-binding transcriptional regulator LsrR (DeoR family)